MTYATPWAILLCKFNDDASEPVSRSHLERVFLNQGNGPLNMINFFSDMSHGLLDLTATRIFGWLTLPFPRSAYMGSGANPAGRNQLLGWVRQAAGSANIDLSQFFNFVAYFNVRTDLFGSQTGIVTSYTEVRPSIIGQEMGHGYGLQHSRTEGSTADYTDRWDVMSTANAWMARDPEFELVGPGLNAANMDSRGWLDVLRIWGPRRYRGTEGGIFLRPLHRRDLPGPLVARIGDFYIEFRNKERWDAEIPRAAVLIHRYAAPNSYLNRANSGQEGMQAGDTFQPGTINSPLQQLTVGIGGIDPANNFGILEIAWQFADELQIISLTSDKKLWHSIRHASTWDSFGDVKAASSDPGDVVDIDCARKFDVDNLHLCAVTDDGRLWHTIRYPTYWDAFGDVKAASSDPGRIVSVSTAIVSRELHVCAITEDGGLWHSIRHSNYWDPFGNVKAVANNPGFVQKVSSAADTGELHVCVVTNDGRLLHTIRRSNEWDSFGDVKSAIGANPGNIINVSVAIVKEELHLVALTDTGGVWHTIRHQTTWDSFGDVLQQVGRHGAVVELECASVEDELHICLVTQTGIWPFLGRKLWHSIRHTHSWDPLGDVGAVAGDRGWIERVKAS